MAMKKEIDAFHDEMIAWRRDLHAHPELGFEEVRTSARIAEHLRSFGIDEIHTLAKTGLVAVIRGGKGGDAVGLRADIDALPISEESDAPHASQNPGVMHACGHDGHTTMLLGAAKYLAASRNFGGTVYLIFQPGEEIGGGKQMVGEGLFERFPMKQVFGMHNYPPAPLGVFQWRNGPMMAAASFFEIKVIGLGAHAAQPHFGVDPIVAGAALVSGLQTIVSRSIDPYHPAVVTVGSFQAGIAANAIPREAILKGTARWFDPQVGETIETAMQRMATGIAESYGARAEVSMRLVAPATMNDADAMGIARQAATAVAGMDRVVEMEEPIMGAEDFAYMLGAKQGAYIMLGAQRPGGHNPMLHNPAFDFNDDILPLGASYWATLVEQQLPA
jgi:amidohydrolase